MKAIFSLIKKLLRLLPIEPRKEFLQVELAQQTNKVNARNNYDSSGSSGPDLY